MEGIGKKSTNSENLSSFGQNSAFVRPFINRLEHWANDPSASLAVSPASAEGGMQEVRRPIPTTSSDSLNRPFLGAETIQTARTAPVQMSQKEMNFYRAIAASCSRSWEGNLPPKMHLFPVYSRKVFVGGIPFGITEAEMSAAFAPFGKIEVEWAKRKGHVHVIFEKESDVKSLLGACDHRDGGWFFQLSSMKRGPRNAEVIPWIVSDNNFVTRDYKFQDYEHTVFVGSVHGQITAEALASIFEQLFGGVVFAGIDTDGYSYPLGSGRVTFGNHKSYMAAVIINFVKVITPSFTKRLQVEPYVERMNKCTSCHLQNGEYFCRELTCFRHFCGECWRRQHQAEGYQGHTPVARTTKKPPPNIRWDVSVE